MVPHHHNTTQIIVSFGNRAFTCLFNISNLQLGYPPLRSIVKLGARRGIEECRKQFNDSSLWNCAFVNQLVDPELPIFVNATLPFGKIAKNRMFGLAVLLLYMVWWSSHFFSRYALCSHFFFFFSLYSCLRSRKASLNICVTGNSGRKKIMFTKVKRPKSIKCFLAC